MKQKFIFIGYLSLMITTENNFIYGLEYTVNQTFPSKKDYESFFTIHTKLVYITSCDIWRDKADLDYSELTFYNVISGVYGILRYKEEVELRELRRKFDLTGGWPHPVEREAKHQLYDLELANTQNPLEPFIPYLKSIIEGDTNAENWFFWMERHSSLLRKIMNPMAFLTLKTDSFREMKKILDSYGIDYTVSPRYSWLSRKRNTHF